MKLIGFGRQVLQEFSKDKVGQISAAFAYGAIFSLGPLLLVLISLAGLVFGSSAAQGKLYGDLANVVGSGAARAIENMVVHIHHSANGSLALLIGTIGLLLGAAGITSQMQNGFDTIFNVVPDPKGGLKRAIYTKLKNVLIVIFGGLIITVSIALSLLIISLGHKIRRYVNLPAPALEVINDTVSWLIFVLILYLIYRTLPDVRLPRKVALAAAFYIGLLFLAGKVLLGLIIGRNGTASAYGAAASLVILLLWIYYSGQILFIGAEGIKVYGFNRSLAYKPKKLSLKRSTVYLDSRNLAGRFAEAWLRGFRKRQG